MKKTLTCVLLSGMLTSCATVMTPPANAYQRVKPSPGQPKREINAPYLVADILLGVIWIPIDFATSKIYKPEPSKN